MAFTTWVRDRQVHSDAAVVYHYSASVPVALFSPVGYQRIAVPSIELAETCIYGTVPSKLAEPTVTT
jgi:hypothetical protein